MNNGKGPDRIFFGNGSKYNSHELVDGDLKQTSQLAEIVAVEACDKRGVDGGCANFGLGVFSQEYMRILGSRQVREKKRKYY